MRAYIGALRTRQATPKHLPKALTSRNYNHFTKVNPFCTRRRGVVQLDGNSLQLSGSLIPPRGLTGRDFHNGADHADERETTMLRKLSLVAVAAASLGTAALAPTSASAWGFHPGWHGGWYHGGPRFYVGGPGYYGYGGCYVRELVPTPWGPRWRLVNRCY